MRRGSRQAAWLGTLMALMSVSLPASAEDGIMIRPQAGIGTLDGKRYEHFGMRILSDVTDVRRYGLEISRLNTRGIDYVAAGIVLEQRLWNWFNMSIGTIGYFGRGAGSRNYPGLVANLGWEPKLDGALKPFVTLRNDILFADKTLIGSAVSAGFAVRF